MMLVLIACICQFAERLAIAHRGGNCAQRLIRSTQREPVSQINPSRPVRINRAFGLVKFPRTQWFFFLVLKRALHFPSQENFFFAIENKIHFFLVGFATDF
jgi:hypothetical protein